MIETSDSVKQIIQSCFNKLRRNGLVIDETEAHFILKMTGFVDYLIDVDIPLIAYEYVRDSLRSDPDVKLSKPLVDFTVVRLTHSEYSDLCSRIEYDRLHKDDYIPKDLSFLDFDPKLREEEIVTSTRTKNCVYMLCVC